MNERKSDRDKANRKGVENLLQFNIIVLGFGDNEKCHQFFNRRGLFFKLKKKLKIYVYPVFNV